LDLPFKTSKFVTKKRGERKEKKGKKSFFEFSAQCSLTVENFLSTKVI